jgi:hypothetical protein
MFTGITAVHQDQVTTDDDDDLDRVSAATSDLNYMQHIKWY